MVDWRVAVLIEQVEPVAKTALGAKRAAEIRMGVKLFAAVIAEGDVAQIIFGRPFKLVVDDAADGACSIQKAGQPVEQFQLPDLLDEHAHAEIVVLHAVDIGSGDIEAAQRRLCNVVDVLGLACLDKRARSEQGIEIARDGVFDEFARQYGDGIGNVLDRPPAPGAGGGDGFGLVAVCGFAFAFADNDNRLGRSALVPLGRLTFLGVRECRCD